ncbi:MAG: MarR family transcriptional regulator [Gammaproteobacteria bacterium]|nr:MarR family transcriptional regulator [Gammaproteobacteria bacterium]
MNVISKYIHTIRHAELDFIKQHLAGLDINSCHLPYLLALLHHDGISQEALSKHTHLDKTTISRIIKPLIEAKYVTRKQDANDKRCYCIFLTKKGKGIIPVLQKVIRKWRKILTANTDKDEQKIAFKVLKQMARNANSLEK